MRAFIDNANISKTLTMLPKFLTLSTFNLYKNWSMFAACDFFCAILASYSVLNANTSLFHARLSLSWASTRARYLWLKSLTKLSMPTALILRPIDSCVSSQGVHTVGNSDAVTVLVMGLPIPIKKMITWRKRGTTKTPYNRRSQPIIVHHIRCTTEN